MSTGRKPGIVTLVVGALALMTTLFTSAVSVQSTTLPADESGTLGGEVVGGTTPGGVPVNPGGGSVTEIRKVTLCHATVSKTNPYDDIDVSVNSVENAISVHGHGDHTGPIYDGMMKSGWGDIIPPFTYKGVNFPGLNWTAEGITAWTNGCMGKQGSGPADTFEWTCQKGVTTDDKGSTCSEGFFGTTYKFSNATWFRTSRYCMTAKECPTPTNDTELPCVPVINSAGFHLECSPRNGIDTIGMQANTSTSCPMNQALRAPYPRALVNVENNFFLEDAMYDAEGGYPTTPQSPANLASFVDANGLPTEVGYIAHIWKDMQLFERSRRFKGDEDWFGQIVPPPQWTFQDRSWNLNQSGYPAVQEGNRARYLYRTSSAGLNTLFGRGFNVQTKAPSNDYSLPAYQVGLRTYCGHEWRATFKLADRHWQKSGDCFATRLFPDGSTYEPPGTSSEACSPGSVAFGSWVYSWKTYNTNWAGIDMTQTGSPTTYDSTTRSVAGGVFQSQVYWDETSGVWVPVVEVQSVLRGGCVATGACAPPRAEPNSVTR